MKKTYVRLNRKLGASDKRIEENGFYEMVIPIKTDDGYKAPLHIVDDGCYFAFKKYLLAGETILINPNGGWNYLLKSDHIIEMYQK